MFPQKQVAGRFNKAAGSYDQAALMQQEVGRRTIERLEFIRIEPTRVLDLGAGSGYCTALLKDRFPEAEVHAVDLAFESLRLHQIAPICADAHFLPFTNDSFDLVFSNMVLHWCENIADVMLEVERVLKPDGVFIFSSLGPDTLKEMRDSWAKIDEYQHVHDFIDMHHIGDALLKCGFSDPVMDSEMLIIEYETLTTLLKDLKNLGVSNIHEKRQRGLMGRQKFQQFLAAYEQYRDEGIYPVTYEVVYGLAFGKKPVLKSDEISIQVTDIRRR